MGTRGGVNDGGEGCLPCGQFTLLTHFLEMPFRVSESYVEKQEPSVWAVEHTPDIWLGVKSSC